MVKSVYMSPRTLHSSSESATFAQTHRDSPKRRRLNGHTSDASGSARRRTACQSCRARKVKCDNARPTCVLCRSSGRECVYLESASERVTLDPSTRLIVSRLDEILENVSSLDQMVSWQMTASQPSPDYMNGFKPEEPPIDIPTIEKPVGNVALEKDYLKIPACKTTADTVLTWPCFGSSPGPNSLISAHYESIAARGEKGEEIEHLRANWMTSQTAKDTVQASQGLRPLPLERIPGLIDRFLQNVHTKNPILDVDSLVQMGRNIAETGLSWDSHCCLVLIACALGYVSCPFVDSLALSGHVVDKRQQDVKRASTRLHAQALQEAESCFVQASQRLGLLTFTIKAAQCHFFAGVYLMYTFRPLLSWNHFYQASKIYQMYLKSFTAPKDEPSPVDVMRLHGMSHKNRRLEQCLYWSCFKSEVELRVELPLEQSTLSDSEYPDLFPSPPSPPSTDTAVEDAFPPLLRTIVDHTYGGSPHVRHSDSTSSLPEDVRAVRRHRHQLYNEEESWYYYLTEVALRRISNRVVNTFFREDPSSWMDITRLIPTALEFESQISTWSKNLPPIMQQYQDIPTHLSKSAAARSTDRYNSCSQELSWDTQNRILEMQSWLYQPFLYHVIHHGWQTLQDGTPILLSTEDQNDLQNIIAAGIECNIQILGSRSILHRHHGIWFDVRALITASLILMAAARSRSIIVPTEIFGLHSDTEGQENNGKFDRVFRALEFWEEETVDLRRSRLMLQDYLRETKTFLLT
ncbi:MAG: hypothetical protein M1828_005987 [Chrysothrix sp. TS-e1954]|nr:MAG: hypothetical protein M1828_005987 [Chrysothrix sp. TS-e1954]